MDLTEQINIEVDKLQERLKETLKQEEQRGADLVGLEVQAEGLEQRAQIFRSDAESTKRKFMFKCLKWGFAIAGIVLVVFVFIYIGRS